MKQFHNDLHTLIVYSVWVNPFGDYIFGHPDVIQQSQNPWDDKPTKAFYDKEKPHNIYIPSRVCPVTGKLKPRDFMNGGYKDGIIVPHIWQMKISLTRILNRAKNPKLPYHLSVDIKAPHKNKWHRLGFATDSKKSVLPELNKLCYAEVYTQELYWSNLRQKANIPEGTEGKDKLGKLIGPDAFRSYNAIVLWRYFDERKNN